MTAKSKKKMAVVKHKDEGQFSISKKQYKLVATEASKYLKEVGSGLKKITAKDLKAYVDNKSSEDLNRAISSVFDAAGLKLADNRLSAIYNFAEALFMEADSDDNVAEAKHEKKVRKLVSKASKIQYKAEKLSKELIKVSAKLGKVVKELEMA